MKESIYDSADVVESYAGVTTPLTFSFARYIYQKAYWNFAKMVGASDVQLRNNASVFEHTIEHIGYRIYNNITSRDTIRSVARTPYVLFTIALLGWRTRRFNHYFKTTFAELQSYQRDDLNLYELERLYRLTEMRLLAEWKVPVANDFVITISTRFAERLWTRWVGSEDAFEHMHLSNTQASTSLDPGNHLLRISRLIRADAEILSLLLSTTSDDAVLDTLRITYPTHTVTQSIDAYIRMYGARMPNELKLEAETLKERPAQCIAIIRKALRSPEKDDLRQIRDINAPLKKLPFIQRWIMRRALHWAGTAIHRREETRFYRTLVYGHIRSIFLSIGTLLEAKKIINTQRDVFYLTTDEVFQSFDLPQARATLTPIIERRKREYAQWERILLPRRIVSEKSIAEIEQELLPHKSSQELPSVFPLKGRVASHPYGVQTFSGHAVSVKEFDPSIDYTDKIIVTCQTDPGWTILFPFIKGIVVERGGMLSHVAVVAREMHIPCIVAVEGATDAITTNTLISLNLETGIIQIL